MKVCHMTSAHGVEDVRIFHKECVSLAKAGYEVYLVERGESYDKDGVHIVGVGEIPKSRRKRMTEGARKVYNAALALDCDVYHFHDPELLPYGKKLKKKGKKVIFDIHENTTGSILEREYLPAPVRTGISKAYAGFERRICRRLDALVTVTPTMTDAYRAVNGNTVELANYPIISDDFVPPTFEKKAVVFAGGIGKKWNHDKIVRALEQLPGCSYVLCGIDQGCVEELKTLPAWDRVEYLGKIPHDRVKSILSQCSVGAALVTPTRDSYWNVGTMGNTKIFEEMSVGLPVVCTNFDLWRRFVEQYHCGICVDPSDEQAIVEAIRYLLEHPEEAKQMGRNGRATVEKEFNWDVEKEKLLALYAQLAG